MSQISKAIQIAKKEGQYSNINFNDNDFNNENGLNNTNIQKIVVSKDALEKNHVLSVIDDNRIIDTYRLLRTRVLRRMQQNKWKSIGVTSAGKDDGKTLTAINLGISIAMKQNFTVVVVDTDLRNPSIHKFFGFKPKVGLGDYLASDMPLEKVLVNPGIDRLMILPGSSNHTQTSSELLSSPKMARLTKDLKTRYPTRIVIFDLPPVLVGDDVVAFAPNLDTVLLVVEEGGTDSGKLKQSIDLLEGVEIIGTILNKSKESLQNQEYYY